MKSNLSGAALATGAACIFVAWCLMPDAATNDANHILFAVANARDHVHASALLQLLGSALLVPGLLAELKAGRSTLPGVLVMLWGVLGMAADAVFHQLAYEMTASGVAREAVLPVMEKMQTVELVPHLPFLLAFPAGALLMGRQARHGGGQAWTAALLVAPTVTIPAGILAVRLLGLPKRAIALIVIGEICLGLVALGFRGVTR